MGTFPNPSGKSRHGIPLKGAREWKLGVYSAALWVGFSRRYHEGLESLERCGALFANLGRWGQEFLAL